VPATFGSTFCLPACGNTPLPQHCLQHSWWRAILVLPVQLLENLGEAVLWVLLEVFCIPLPLFCDGYT
jgi:hypothetical protein